MCAMVPDDLDFASITPAGFAQALAENSFVVLRKTLSPERLRPFLTGVVELALAFWGDDDLTDEAHAKIAQYPGAPLHMDKDSYHRMAVDGCVSDAMLRYATDDRHSLYDLISMPRLWGLLTAATYGAPL